MSHAVLSLGGNICYELSIPACGAAVKFAMRVLVLLISSVTFTLP